MAYDLPSVSSNYNSVASSPDNNALFLQYTFAFSKLLVKKIIYIYLPGNVIDIQSGRWIGKLSGLGAGLDSFYEYLLKVYILVLCCTYWYEFLKVFINDTFITVLHCFWGGRRL